MRGQPLIRGHFLRYLSNHPHVTEPVLKGHCLKILRCSLKTRFPVLGILYIVILSLVNGDIISFNRLAPPRK